MKNEITKQDIRRIFLKSRPYRISKNGDICNSKKRLDSPRNYKAYEKCVLVIENLDNSHGKSRQLSEKFLSSLLNTRSSNIIADVLTCLVNSGIIETDNFYRVGKEGVKGEGKTYGLTESFRNIHRAFNVARGHNPVDTDQTIIEEQLINFQLGKKKTNKGKGVTYQDDFRHDYHTLPLDIKGSDDVINGMVDRKKNQQNINSTPVEAKIIVDYDGEEIDISRGNDFCENFSDHARSIYQEVRREEIGKYFKWKADVILYGEKFVEPLSVVTKEVLKYEGIAC